MQTIPWKQGDTFANAAVVTDSDGGPVLLTGYTITSEVRNVDGTLISIGTVTITDAAQGAFDLTYSAADTAAWPEGLLFMDVQFMLDDVVVSSETIRIQVLRDITGAS